MSSLLESVRFLSSSTNPQGLMDPHVPSVLLSQVTFQNLKQAVLSKTQVQLTDPDKLLKVFPQPDRDQILNYNTIS